MKAGRAPILLLLFPLAAPAQESRPASAGLQALQRAVSDHQRRLLGVTGQRLLAAAQGTEKAEEAWLEALAQADGELLLELAELAKRHPAGPAGGRIRFELGRALLRAGRPAEAVAAFRGLKEEEPRHRLQAALELARLGEAAAGAGLVAGLGQEALPGDRDRLALAALAALAGGEAAALEALGDLLPGPAAAPPAWLAARADLEAVAAGLPLSLERALRALFLREWHRRQPDDPAAQAAAALLPGLGVGPGSPAPALAGRTVDGLELDWQAFRGRPLLLLFWEAGAAEATAATARWRRLLAAGAARGLAGLAIALEPDGERARQLRDQEMPGVATLWQAGGRNSPAAAAYGVFKVPFAVLLDREGRVAALGLEGTDLERRTAALLAPGQDPASREAGGR